MQMEKQITPHCSVIRYVSQCTPDGKCSYGYHHQQCDNQNGCSMHPTNKRLSITDAAKLIEQMNGHEAIRRGFTTFYTWTQSYGGMTATGQPYLGHSKMMRLST